MKALKTVRPPKLPEPLQQLEEEPEPEKEEATATPEFNVIKIHGEDFVLTPVEKKNDQ